MIVQDQCLSEQAVRPTVVATSRLGAQTQRERVELDERVSEETELDVAVEDSWTLENKGSGRPRSLVGSQVSMSGPKPHTTQYLVEPDDVRASGRGYVSNKGTHVDEIERSITQSSQGDMVQIQPSETDDVLTDARSASRKSSYLGKVALGRSSSPYDDTQATDVAMAYTSSYLADVKTKMSDSSTFDGGAHEARERHRLARKPALPAIGEPSQAEKVWESSVDVSRKMTAASPIYGAAPAHSPPDAGHRLGKRAHEEFRQADAVDVDLTWDEAPHTTAPSARQKYLVPLSEYLEPEGHAAGYLVASRERKEVSFGQKSDETRHYRNAIEDSERTRVAQKNEKQEKVTKMNIVADNDGSKATSSKKEGSVVSAVLATACVAALAFEAAAESRQKERSGRTEVNHGKLARDRDHSPVGREPARIIEDNQRVTNEKNVAVTRTAQRTAMVDTPVSQKTAKTAITAQVALGEAETEIHHNSFVDERTSRQERDDDQKRVDWVDSRSGVSAVDVDVRTNERATESTHHSVAAEDAVSVQRTPSAEERTIQKLSSNQKSQTGVESGRALQASETRKQKDESEQATYATRLDTSREQMADMSLNVRHGAKDGLSYRSATQQCRHAMSNAPWHSQTQTQCPRKCVPLLYRPKCTWTCGK
ncbi:hypothetical protein OG21DRAFT_1284030 [Imleria badia]|nr:hypothetical protein OG21DRAFT_1284030 [Imleria badia]